MRTRRASETTPDLFQATPTPKAPGSQTIPVRENLASQSRYLLPKDLAGALERLDDTEVMGQVQAKEVNLPATMVVN